MNNDLFYIKVTVDYFYAKEVILEKKTPVLLRNRPCFLIKWFQGIHSKKNYLTIDQMKLICKAMEITLGYDALCTLIWNDIYSKCLSICSNL